jgi:hypothetical protein
MGKKGETDTKLLANDPFQVNYIIDSCFKINVTIKKGIANSDAQTGSAALKIKVPVQ